MCRSPKFPMVIKRYSFAVMNIPSISFSNWSRASAECQYDSRKGLKMLCRNIKYSAALLSVLTWTGKEGNHELPCCKGVASTIQVRGPQMRSNYVVDVNLDVETMPGPINFVVIPVTNQQLDWSDTMILNSFMVTIAPLTCNMTSLGSSSSSESKTGRGNRRPPKLLVGDYNNGIGKEKQN